MSATSADEDYDGLADGEFAVTLTQVLISSFVRETSVQFRFATQYYRDCARRLWTIYSSDGITYIAGNKSPEKERKEYFTTTFTVPEDGEAPADLCKLTRELAQFTSELFDIEIQNLSLTWGVKPGTLPSLLDCDGVYRCARDSEPHANFLMDIGFFIALETGQVPEPGRCFTRKAKCTGADVSCPRHKIEVWRIKELGNGLNVRDLNEFLRYVKRRIGLICPALLLSSVLVCRGCFAVYSKEQTPPKGSEITSARAIPVPSPRSIAPPAVRASAPAAAERPNTVPGTWVKSRSGLTYVQDFGLRACGRAHKVYIARPFPVFLQRPL
jgi:hypothetical protein